MRRSLGHIPRTQPEPTIALINIVFLMLIFFLIAGSIAPSPDPDVQLVTLSEITTEPPRDALVLLADGALRLNGLAVSAGQAVSQLAGTTTVRVLPDRAAPAADLVALAQQLRAGGAEKLMIVTSEALQ
ncbi:ExbD/TolR family protein [Roseicitreum antarcticum]|uniref:Biopolymer transport protein ExbD n=1 Tax=Roseicitreum antarcticum TaxID=564137 RepID=A0A1H2UA62_9RHOB|nr:biopolymer transporter ExbD [Roseicitreum antarcticum]SDW52509.1 biopolymer transport protein ExbD [Roseicitreum antarcticum]